MTTTTSGVVYVYGGASGGRPLAEVYCLDLSRSYWERVSVTNPTAEPPPPKVGHACVYVEVSWRLDRDRTQSEPNQSPIRAQ